MAVEWRTVGQERMGDSSSEIRTKMASTLVSTTEGGRMSHTVICMTKSTLEIVEISPDKQYTAVDNIQWQCVLT